jgi:hypothetical protein
MDSMNTRALLLLPACVFLVAENLRAYPPDQLGEARQLIRDKKYDDAVLRELRK